MSQPRDNVRKEYEANMAGAGKGIVGHSGYFKADGSPLFNPGGRNRRTVWTIPTQPFPGSHFAVFPRKLVEPMILAGTSPKACEYCGAPWGRLVSKSREATRPGRTAKAEGMEFDKGRHCTTSKTIGWRPTCSHYDSLYQTEFRKARSARKRWQRVVSGNWWKRVRRRPGLAHWKTGKCIVLDPFMGSGTVAVVAANLGRDYIGFEPIPIMSKWLRGVSEKKQAILCLHYEEGGRGGYIS